MQTKWLFLLCLTSLSLLADEPCSSCNCEEGPSAGWLNLRHKEPGGIGYPDGYSSIDIFYAPNCTENFYSFIDLRGHVFNNGKWATNAGVGLRYLSDSYNLVSGLNFFWDWRESSHMNFHQLGGGLEFLWPHWDFRLNGYVPISRTKRSYQQGLDHFENHRAIVFKEYELALWGADTSLGYWLYRCGWFGIHTSLGGYYFRGDFSTHVGGGLVKAKVQVTDYISLEGQVSYDNQFKWVGQGELALHIPFGPSVARYERSVCSCCDLIDLEYRISEQVDRFEIPVTLSHKRKGEALNPNTGTPLTFFFVNNTSHSEGTFESPFPTLLQAQNASSRGDVLYLFPGDGTDTGMDRGVILKNDQFLVGSGAPFVVGSPFGLITIPAQSDTLPKVSNSGNMGSPAVTVMNHNLVSGLDLSSASSAPILFGGKIKGLVVQSNQLSSAAQFGILINTFAKEDLIIQNNRMNANSSSSLFAIEVDTFTGRDCIVQNNGIELVSTTINGVNGIVFDFFAGRDFIAQNNTMHLTGGEADGIGIRQFNGRDFITQNNTMHLTANSGDSSGIEMFLFEGKDFIATSNAMFLKGSDDAQGIIAGYVFSGRDCIIQNNTMNLTAGDDLFTIGIVQFNGRDFITTSNTMSLKAVNDAYGVSIPKFFRGRDFIAQNNTIESVGGTNVFGIDVSSDFTAAHLILQRNSIAGLTSFPIAAADCLIEYNQFQFLNLEFFNTSPVFALIRNNSATGVNSGIFLNAQGTVFEAIIQNNTAPEGFIDIENSKGKSHIRFSKNQASDGIFFGNTGIKLEVESPNSKLSGLQAINKGEIDTSGVTFVPFE